MPSVSEVWRFFEKSEDKKTAKCNLCTATIQLHGGTSNLHNHMRYKHPSENRNKKTQETVKQTRLSDFCAPRRPSGSDDKITQAIADMCVSDYVPISIVENAGFRNLMTLLAPDYKIPCRKTINARIEDRYHVEKTDLIRNLEDVKSAAITTDTWTSNSTESYLTVTEHHIDDDWSLQANVLATRAMPESHTGSNLASRLNDCVSEFHLEQRISACTHDNARNMDAAGRQCQWTDVGCFGHTLQLCIKPVFDIPTVKEAVSKCRKLVGHFKHSTTLSAELRERQLLLKAPKHELIQDVATRWNSTQLMLSRLVEQRRVLTDIMLDARKKCDPGLQLRDTDWEIVGEVSDVLQDFTDTTTYMCTEANVSASEIYPVVCGLVKNSLVTSAEDSDLVAEIKDTIRDELVRRYQPETLATASGLPIMASLLDSRYKSLRFLSSDQRRAAHDALESAMDDLPLVRRVRDESEPTPSKRPRLSFMITSPEKESSDELASYLREKAETADPLDWWKNNETRYPTIALVARKVLCVPATSVPSERIFSNTGRLINKLRNRLSSELVDKIVFLNKNCDVTD